MIESLHKSPSVGSVINKLLSIDPELSTSELIGIIHQSTVKRGGAGSEFSNVEIIDEKKALSLVRKSPNRQTTNS